MAAAHSGPPTRADVALTAVYWSAAAALALYFTHLHFTLNTESAWGTFAGLIEGTALTPFQYRVLIPWLVGALARLPGLSGLALPSLYQAVEVVAVFALVLAFRKYLSLFVRGGALTAVLSLSVYYALPFHYLFPRRIALIYPSDLPSILFFTLGLILLYRRNWMAYYPLFLAATLNRETALFLTAVYVVTAIGRSPRRTVLVHALAQVVLWVAVKSGLFWLYRDNPGYGLFEDQLLRNLAPLTDWSVLLTVAGMWGFTWIAVLAGHRRIEDAFVRRSLLVAIPYLLGLATVGVVDEMRIYGDLIPLVLGATWLVVLGPRQVSVPAPVPADAVSSTVRERSRATRPVLRNVGLAAGTLVLALVAFAAYVVFERQANAPVEDLRASLDHSLARALPPAEAGQRVLVVNWPRALRSNRPTRLMGVFPFTPSPALSHWPADAPASTARLQFLPWQRHGNGVNVEFSGAGATQEELTAHVRQADRVLDFNADLTQMYTLAEWLPADSAETCRAEFEAGVCLVEAWLVRQGGQLRADLLWRVRGRPAPAVTVFVHLLDATGALVAQADGDPVRNLLPLASWPGAEIVLREARWAPAPAVDHHVRVGLYDRATGQRLEATCAAPDVCGADGLVIGPALAFP